MLRLRAFLIGMMAIILSGCSEGPSSGNTAQEMFEHLIQKPVPTDVMNLQGVGDTWQGYSIWLRFTASDTYIESLLQTGFEPVSCDTVKNTFDLPQGYDRFEPSWNPVFTECFENNAANNDWGSGQHVLGIDHLADTIYFYGSAA